MNPLKKTISNRIAQKSPIKKLSHFASKASPALESKSAADSPQRDHHQTCLAAISCKPHPAALSSWRHPARMPEGSQLKLSSGFCWKHSSSPPPLGGDSHARTNHCDKLPTNSQKLSARSPQAPSKMAKKDRPPNLKLEKTPRRSSSPFAHSRPRLLFLPVANGNVRPGTPSNRSVSYEPI